VARNRFDSLRKESQDLEMQIRQLTDALETLVRIQAKYIEFCITLHVNNRYAMNIFIYRSLESQLFNKANEIQEDISSKRFDLRVAQIHLAAVRAQVSKFYIQQVQVTN